MEGSNFGFSQLKQSAEQAPGKREEQKKTSRQAGRNREIRRRETPTMKRFRSSHCLPWSRLKGRWSYSVWSVAVLVPRCREEA